MLFADGGRGLRLRYIWIRIFQLLAIWSLGIVGSVTGLGLLLDNCQIFPSPLPNLYVARWLIFGQNRTFQFIAIWTLNIVEGAIDMEVLIDHSHIFPSSLTSLWQPFGVLCPSFTLNRLTSCQIRGTLISISGQAYNFGPILMMGCHPRSRTHDHG